MAPRAATSLMVDQAPETDLEVLMRPLAGPDPSGRALQYDLVYDRIKEARRADDLTAPRDVWSKDLKVADWEEVAHLGASVLQEQSKDLQVCAWLAEAWLHLEGLTGLERGVQLLLLLSEGYWETVHPTLKDGAEFRAAPFTWVNEKLPAALGRVTIAHPEGDARPATWDDWKRALWLDKVQARRPQDPEIQRELETSLTIEGFRRLCQKTPEAFFRANLVALDDTIATTRALESFLDDRLGDASPSLVGFREAVNELRTWTEVMLRDGSYRPETRRAEAMPEEPSVAPEPSAAAKRTGRVGSLESREDAYRMLHEAAAYLKQIEPHSPTPYLVLKAVAWGDKTLDDLLREFVRDGLNLEALFTILGIEHGEDR